MILFLLSLLTATFIGFTLIHYCFPVRGKGVLLFKICLSMGLGLGITSCVFFLSLVAVGTRFVLMPELLLLLLTLGVGWFMLGKNIPPPISSSTKRREKFAYQYLLAALLGAGLLSSFASFVLAVIREPHGKWDAWLIWNMHARFIYRAGERWQEYFSSGLTWTHPDYPLMLPLSIVRSWTYMGVETHAIPIALSFLFTFALIGLMVSSLVMLRDRSQGYLGGLVLTGSPFFILMGASQLADIPLAFFLLASVVLLFLHDRVTEGNHLILILSGVAAGLLTWTKNEGVLIALLLIFVRFLVIAFSENGKSAINQIIWLMVGAFPISLATAIFKGMLAPSTDIFSGQNIHVIGERLSDLARYKTILIAYIQTGLTFTQGIPDIRTGFRFDAGIVGIVSLVLYLLLTGTAVDQKEKMGILSVLLLIVITLSGYFLIYLITPHNLEWHLITSLNRLFTQLWPVIILITFMAARSPATVFSKDERQKRSSRKEKTNKNAS